MKLGDPVRLSELGGEADTELREILQGLRASGPVPSQIESLVRSVEQAVHTPAAPQSAAHGGQLSTTPVLNIVTGTLVAGLACAAVYFLHGEAPSASPQRPPAAATLAAPAHPPASLPTESVRPRTDVVAPTLARDREADPSARAPIERAQAAIELPARPPQPGVLTRSPQRRTKVRSHLVADAPRLGTGAGHTLDPHDRQEANQLEPARPATSVAGPGLASELELLTEAQRALATAPARSLELVERHKSSFPNGTFAQERDELRIDALCRLGRVDQAKWYAGEFARAYPRSAHLVRIRRVIANSSR